MYLSYSGKKKTDCLYEYWNAYINNTPLPTPDNRLGSIFGSSVGKIFERFYVERVWEHPTPESLMVGWAEEMVHKVIKDETSPSKYRAAGVLLWAGMEGATTKAYANPEQIVSDVKDSISRGISIIRKEALLGPRAEAEVKLDHTIEGHRFGGRADFLTFRSRHKDLVLTDGKGSKDKKWVDRQQLVWYSMLLHRKEGRLPDKVGFIFWQFQPHEALEWSEVTLDETEALLSETLEVIAKIEDLQKTLGSEKRHLEVQQVFKPKPSKEGCRYCPYAHETICAEGLKMALKSRTKTLKLGLSL